jgi:2-succinyl-6-hydroxy-2,4-cyclohexadiene-1-carboxylate synthase
VKRLVCLHGFTGGPTSFDALRNALGHDFELVTPTLSGHMGLGFERVESFEDEVTRLLEACGSAPVALVGYSLGGRLALGMLCRDPARFSAALLIGAHPGLTSETERAERLRSDARWAALLRERGLEAFLAEWESQPLFSTQAKLPPERLESQRAVRHGHSAEGLARSLELFGLGKMPERWSALPGVDVPVTLAAGELDLKFRALAERALEVLPRGRAAVAPGAGHNLLLERPEWVAQAIFSACSPA